MDNENRTQVEANDKLQKKYDEMNDDRGIPRHKIGDEHPMISILKMMVSHGIDSEGEADCTTCAHPDCDARDAEWSGKGDGMPKPISPEALNDEHECQDEMKMPDDTIHRYTNKIGTVIRSKAAFKEDTDRAIRARNRMYHTGLRHGTRIGILEVSLKLMEFIAGITSEYAVEHRFATTDSLFVDSLNDIVSNTDFALEQFKLYRKRIKDRV